MTWRGRSAKRRQEQKRFYDEELKWSSYKEHKGNAREPMKDVTNCDKPRGAVSERYIRGFPNGAIRQEESLVIIC